MIGGPASETLVRFTALATVAGCSMAAVFATVTPGSSEMNVFSSWSGPQCSCTTGDQTVSNSSGLNTLQKSVESSCQCPSITTAGKAKGTVSWKHSSEGSSTAQLSHPIRQPSRCRLRQRNSLCRLMAVCHGSRTQPILVQAPYTTSCPALWLSFPWAPARRSGVSVQAR
jgi:hypothetical protein